MVSIKDVYNWHKWEKGLKIFVSTYTILFCADMISTLITPHYQYLETNPLYLMFNSMVPIILANIFFIGGFIWLYQNTSPTHRYYLTLLFVLTNLARLSAIIGNLTVFSNPVSLETAQTISVAAKEQYYKKNYSSLTPMLVLNFITFLVYKIDHQIRKKGDYIEVKVQK